MQTGQTEGRTAAQSHALSLSNFFRSNYRNTKNGQTDGVYLKALPKELRAVFKAVRTCSFMNRTGLSGERWGSGGGGGGGGGPGAGALLSTDDGRRSAQGTLLQPLHFYRLTCRATCSATCWPTVCDEHQKISRGPGSIPGHNIWGLYSVLTSVKYVVCSQVTACQDPSYLYNEMSTF